MAFHTKALEFIGTPVSAGTPTSVEEAEQRLQITFPRSVREWYSDVNGQQLLGRYSNGDVALEPSAFRLEEIDNKRLVVFLIENQGVCWWGFDVDAGEDPPVYVDLDPPPDELFLYSRTFSEFTFVRVFDHDGFWDDQRHSLETYRSLQDGDLAALRADFVEEPKSMGWPGTDVYRFRSDLGRITIWHGPEQSDWTMSALNRDALEQLRKKVARICRRFD